ncbi:MAG: hypothetical protein VB118_02775 [Oscillospiraceae bacterium]|nr:hypothetical protein [Oscillospiraceae bacterium]
MKKSRETEKKNSELPNAGKYKHRLGDRKDGRKLRSLQPISTVAAYIMPTRNGASNLINDSVEISEIEKFILKKRGEGLKGFGIIHFFIAAYIRLCSQRPGINRFISGQRIYTRDYVEVNMAVKKDFALDAEETMIKMVFDRAATVTDVYNKMTELTEQYKNDSDGPSDFDNFAKVLNFIPGIVLKFAVWNLNLWDYFGWLPKSWTDLSPFHGSLVITSMGSLGIPPVYHHLYNFGNVPVFFAYGAKRFVRELNEDGQIQIKKLVDFTFVTDERICDGYYFASALKLLRQLCKNPAMLDIPPETIIDDIE